MPDQAESRVPPEKRPYGLTWRSKPLFIIFTVGLGMFSDLFLYALLVPVFPFLLVDRMNTPPELIQEYVSMLLAMYAGASAISSPLIGLVSDKIANTRQLPFMLGLLALLAGTVLVAVGQTVPVLAAARLLQGASSGIVWTCGLAMLVETVGPSRLGLAIGTIFSFLSFATLVGPTLGGILYEKTGYGGVFGVSAGILVLDLILRLLVIERRAASKYIDWEAENNYDSGSEDSDSDEENEAGHPDEETPLINDGQRNRKDKYAEYVLGDTKNYITRNLPIIRTFRSPSLVMALMLSVAQATLLGAFDATVPTLAENYYGFNSLAAGLLFLPLGITDLLIGPIGGWATDKLGTKFTAVAGFGYLCPALVLLRLAKPGGTEEVTVYCVLLAICGIGLAVIGAPAIVEAGAEMERYDKANPTLFGKNGPYAQMYGMTSMLFSLGLTIGPIAAGELKDSIGYGNMNAILGAGSLGIAILSFLYVGGKPRLPSWVHKRQNPS